MNMQGGGGCVQLCKWWPYTFFEYFEEFYRHRLSWGINKTIKPDIGESYFFYDNIIKITKKQTTNMKDMRIGS